MGVYIKGMEMPTSCEECQTLLGCCDELEDGTVWCRLAHGYIGDERTVCSLVPVPPHGRLIDADALKENCMKEDGFLAELLFRKVSNAPTIIPANGKDTNIPTREEGET